MTPYDKIRAALEIADRKTDVFDAAKAALAELERAAQTPAPVAEIREAVITDEMCARVCDAWYAGFGNRAAMASGRDMIAAVRAELGPALGLVELKWPTPEECERICTEYERLLMREGTCGGRDAFDAVRAVMWPKSEGS